MTDKIAPALTPEEWDGREPFSTATLFPDGSIGFDDARGVTIELDGARKAAIAIALLNFALPDSDPRKITRQKVWDLQTWIGPLNSHAGFRDLAVVLHHHLKALESYLPPEK